MDTRLALSAGIAEVRGAPRPDLARGALESPVPVIGVALKPTLPSVCWPVLPCAQDGEPFGCAQCQHPERMLRCPILTQPSTTSASPTATSIAPSSWKPSSVGLLIPPTPRNWPLCAAP